MRSKKDDKLDKLIEEVQSLRFLLETQLANAIAQKAYYAEKPKKAKPASKKPKKVNHLDAISVLKNMITNGREPLG